MLPDIPPTSPFIPTRRNGFWPECLWILELTSNPSRRWPHIFGKERKGHEEGCKVPSHAVQQMWMLLRQLSEHTLLLCLMQKLLSMSLDQFIIEVRIGHFWIVSFS